MRQKHTIVKSYQKRDGTRVRRHRRRLNSRNQQNNRQVRRNRKRTYHEPIKPTHFYVASYSKKAKTREKLIETVKTNPKNPDFDIYTYYMGEMTPYGHPEDIRKFFGIEEFTVIGPRKSYYAQLIYTKNGEWEVR